MNDIFTKLGQNMKSIRTKKGMPQEEKDAEKEFGTQWDEYARKTPAFIPKNIYVT